jgi:hypothetical protein
MHNRFLSASLLILGSVLLLLSPGYARKHEHRGEGFSIVLNQPYDQVLKVIQEVTSDGIIRSRLNTMELMRSMTPPPPRLPVPLRFGVAGGTVLYKERPDTLAPEHFYDTGDIGTVVVRYVVRPMGPNMTRLRIDALSTRIPTTVLIPRKVRSKAKSLRQSHPGSTIWRSWRKRTARR